MIHSYLELFINHLKDLKQSGIETVSYDLNSLHLLEKALQRRTLTMPGAQTTFISTNKPMPHSTEPELFDTSAISTLLSAKKRASTKSTEYTLPSPPVVELPEGDKAFQINWLKERVLGCSVCKSHVKPGKKVVFGVGSIDADIFFCGEAPGADEEIQGEPFVGPAGQLLTKVIQAMGLSRSQVYIGNIMNWRPEMPTAFGNRPPTQEEMNFCLPYLKAQVDIVRPKVIVALGATAAHGLLGYDAKRRITECRGKWTSFNHYPLMITFHPSYLLRNNTLQSKRLLWEDMLEVMGKVGLPVSEKQKGYFYS